MQIELKPSKALIALLLLMLAGSLLCVFWAELPLYLQLLLAIPVLIYGGKVLHRDGLQKDQRAIVALESYDDNNWQLTEASGETYAASLSPGSVLMGLFCLLRFKRLEDGQTRSLLLLKATLAPETYRRLLMKVSTLTVD